MSNSNHTLKHCLSRLNDCHRLWHQAESSYFEPETFRLNIQSFITTLRTVTFLLQKHKSSFKDFDQWYSLEQRKLKSDSVMTWLVDSRNVIEKEGDLDYYSTVRVELIASYHEKHYLILDNNDSCLFSTFNDLLEQAKTKLNGINFIDDGLFRISRRWIVNSYPDEELLSLCKYGYQKINTLINNAGEYLNESIDVKKCFSREVNIPICMDISSEEFSACFLVKDLSSVSLNKTNVSGRNFEDILKHYPSLEQAKIKLNAELSQSERVKQIFEFITRETFLKDGFHSSMIILFNGEKQGQILQLEFEDKVSKYHIMNNIAQEVLKSECDAVALIGECWKRLLDLSIEGEVLTLDYLQKDGLSFSLSADILRKDESISLGNTIITDKTIINMLAPIYKVWNLPFRD